MVQNGDYYLHSPDTRLSNTINVFPNPSDGLFNFKLSVNSNQIEIIDICGRLVYRESLQTNQEILELNLEALPGIYLAKIFAGNDVYVLRLICR